ncbi:hypothetical protein EJ04DRAFT_513073 [Polyplosphaeria fusca]|uniref:DUF7719 domain-containing protein n=1 Tax=Polyplosphaeria fusca TaxID=682080 RepID=A0A9P4QW56_9PLEO|nr:hypothetical protein EJ04DRAFT_513073 [Polyplosphaeria fusca]
MAGNRKERRAAAKNDKKPSSSTTTSFEPSTEIDEDGVEYILRQPDWTSGPKGKTLFDLAAERQKELDKQNPSRRNVNLGNTPPGERPFNDEDPIGPLGDAILYSISLAMLHLTLDVIVYSQYREEVLWAEVFLRAGKAMPIFALLVYVTHVDISKRVPLLRNLIFAVVSTVAGCYFLYFANEHGYFFVMKAAPPIGSLWMWSLIETDKWFALISAISCLAYAWWNSYDVLGVN